MGAPIPSATGPVRIRSRFVGASGPPAVMFSGEISYNAVDDIMSIGVGDDGTGQATSVLSIAGKGAFLAKALLGIANGVATLDATGKLTTAQIPGALLGAMQFQGTWNASTNTPALASGVGVKGQFYKVSVAGTTNLDGYNKWQVGDLVLFDGTTWDGVDGNSSEVQAVAGRTGMVTLTSADLTDATAVGRALLALGTVAAVRTNIQVDGFQPLPDTIGATVTYNYTSLAYTSLTAARVINLAALATFNPGQRIRIRDNSGACSATNTITITPNGSEKINGAANLTLNVPYQSVELEASGGQWAVVALYPPFATNTSGGVNAGTY